MFVTAATYLRLHKAWRLKDLMFVFQKHTQNIIFGKCKRLLISETQRNCRKVKYSKMSERFLQILNIEKFLRNRSRSLDYSLKSRCRTIVLPIMGLKDNFCKGTKLTWISPILTRWMFDHLTMQKVCGRILENFSQKGDKHYHLDVLLKLTFKLCFPYNSTKPVICHQLFLIFS